MQYYAMEPASLLDLGRSPLVDAALIVVFVAVAVLGTLLSTF
jgi:hypothetical protein